MNPSEKDSSCRTSRSIVPNYILGECRLLGHWLSRKKSTRWLPIKILDAVFRGFSQVVFANNPFSGLFVIIGLACADLTVCAAGILAASMATIAALIFDQPWTAVGNGLFTYNGVLVGTVTQSLCESILEKTGGPAYFVWCLIAFGGALSALVTSGMANLCKGASLPAMTVPFNLIDLLIFISLPSALNYLSDGRVQGSSMLAVNVTTPMNSSHALIEIPTVDWLMVLRGAFVSMGQVYAAESVACSVLMYVGITLFSPYLSLTLFVGSLVESVCALGLTDDYSEIYSGLWGYNAALTSGAIAATFYVPTVLSFVTAISAIIFTAASQRAFSLVLAPAKLPVLTIPFVTTASIFLAVSSGSVMEGLVKSPDGRPPEYQRKRHSKQRSISENSISENSC